jgi:hypothetical protein
MCKVVAKAAQKKEPGILARLCDSNLFRPDLEAYGENL